MKWQTVQTLIRLLLFALALLNRTKVTHDSHEHMSRVVRKPAFCICENKDADQLRGYREADQRLCFRYIDSTIPLLYKSEISSLYSFSVAVQPGLCQTWTQTPKTGFLRTRLILTLKRSDLSLLRETLPFVSPTRADTNQSAQLQKLEGLQLSLIVRKPVFGVSDQVRHKPG